MLLPLTLRWTALLLQEAPSFNQLPLPMRITFTVIAIGTMYAVWVLVFRDLVRQATRVEARDRARLARLAEIHALGAAAGEPFVLDRINVADTDESERAYTAVQLYTRGLAMVSLYHQGWQSEMTATYDEIEAVRSYAERQLTGFRAAILGPLAYLVQKKRYYLGLLIKNQDGLIQTVLLQGKRSTTEKMATLIDLARNTTKPTSMETETTLSTAG